MDDGFGCSVAVSNDGNTIVVGALRTTVGSNSNQGAAYVFTKAPTAAWDTVSSFAAKLTASELAAPDNFFGTTVAISGDASTVAVFVPRADSNVDGAVYLFVEPPTGWASASPLHEVNFILGPPFFGGDQGIGPPTPISAIALSNDGSTLAVGSPEATVNSNADQGEVEVFVTTDGWMDFNSSQLTASDGVANDGLGQSASISDDGNSIVAGKQGAVYVFTKPTGGWGTSMETAKLTGIGNGGISVGITSTGDTIVVANPNEAADVFVRPTNGAWVTTSSPTATLTPSNADSQEFANYVTISSDGSAILVGALFDIASQNGGGYLFTRPAAGWTSSTETAELSCFLAASITATRSKIVYFPPFYTIAAGSLLTVGTSACQNQNGQQYDLTYVFTGYTQSSFPSLSVQQVHLIADAGAISGSQPVTVTNSGTAPLGISNVAATGPFTTTQNCATESPIQPGGSCTEEVTFTASGVGSFTGTLTFTDDAGEVVGSTQQVTLNGAGVDFSLSISPSSQTIPPGHLASYTLTVKSMNGYAGTVSVACGSEPPHTHCSVSPASVTLLNSSSTSIITIDQENKGTYRLTFVGNDGTVTHSVTATLQVK